MADIEVREGQFAIVSGWSIHSVSIARVDALTAKMVRTRRGSSDRFSQVPRSSVMAVFDREADAARIVQTVDGIRGEYQRRACAASEWCQKAISDALAKA